MTEEKTENQTESHERELHNLDSGKKKKKKKKYSPGFRMIQEGFYASSKMSEQMAKAQLKSLKEFNRAWDRSARKQRDGGMIDVLRISASAFSVQARHMAEVPSEFMDNAGSLSKLMKPGRMTRASLRAFGF